MDIPSGSAPPNPAPPTTSPRPASTCCPRSTPAAAAGLKTLTDKGYIGAGIGIPTPIKGRNLATANRTRNTMITALRAPAERANALLKRTWKTLERITLDPGRMTAIIAAALVLLHLQRPAW